MDYRPCESASDLWDINSYRLGGTNPNKYIICSSIVFTSVRILTDALFLVPLALLGRHRRNEDVRKLRFPVHDREIKVTIPLLCSGRMNANKKCEYENNCTAPETPHVSLSPNRIAPRPRFR